MGLALESRGLAGFLPHRDTDQTSSPQQRFKEDVAGILSSKIVLAIAENESPNWGAEVGFAYGRGIPVVALLKKGHEIPLITAGMIREKLEVDDLDNIENYIEELISLVKSNDI